MPILVGPTQFKIFPNGVKAAVVRTRDHSVPDWAVAAEALTHHTKVTAANPDYIREALRNDKMQSYRLMWGQSAREGSDLDRLRRRYVTAGGATEFLSVITTPDDKDYPAIRGEDTYVSPEESSEFRGCTIDASHPKGIGLGTFFIHERIRIAVMRELGLTPYGVVSKGRIGEYSPHSTEMIALFQKLRATMGQEEQSGVWHLDGFPAELRDRARRARIHVVPEGLGFHSGDILPNIFVVSWRGDKGERIKVSVTEAGSTFLKQAIGQVQLTSNHRWPDRETLKDVLASLMMAVRTEILIRKHISGHAGMKHWDLDDEHMILRMNDLNESPAGGLGRQPVMGPALEEMGARRHTVGTPPHAMLPLITYFENIPDGVLDFSIPIAKPFITTPLEHSARRRLPLGIDLSKFHLD
jgi:hypothetical protein